VRSVLGPEDGIDRAERLASRSWDKKRGLTSASWSSQARFGGQISVTRRVSLAGSSSYRLVCGKVISWLSSAANVRIPVIPTVNSDESDTPWSEVA
jgi:hypothetical protein